MLYGNLIQRIMKTFLCEHACEKQLNGNQKQSAIEERVTTAEALLTHDQPAKNTQRALSEREMLTQAGFTTEEVLALVWLRQWYQSGGSDRVIILRHLEFLKHLLKNGRLER